MRYTVDGHAWGGMADTVVLWEDNEGGYEWDLEALLLTRDGRLLVHDDHGNSCSSPYDNVYNDTVFEIKDTPSWWKAKNDGASHELLVKAAEMLMMTEEQRRYKFAELVKEVPPAPEGQTATYLPDEDAVVVNGNKYVRPNAFQQKRLEEKAAKLGAAADRLAQALLDIRQQGRTQYAVFANIQSAVDEAVREAKELK